MRSIKLTLPKNAVSIGQNVTGQIAVVDTIGKDTAPVPGATVALQQMRGKSYVTMADGETDANGQFAVSFMSKTNATWRAVLKPASGKEMYTPVVTTKASAMVSWAARPDMEVKANTSTVYAFRVTSGASTNGNLEYALASAPTKWTVVKATSVPANDIIRQAVKFPKAGTYLLRGASAATATTAPGYTTSLEIEVN